MTDTDPAYLDRPGVDNIDPFNTLSREEVDDFITSQLAKQPAKFVPGYYIPLIVEEEVEGS